MKIKFLMVLLVLVCGVWGSLIAIPDAKALWLFVGSVWVIGVTGSVLIGIPLFLIRGVYLLFKEGSLKNLI